MRKKTILLTVLTLCFGLAVAVAQDDLTIDSTITFPPLDRLIFDGPSNGIIVTVYSPDSDVYDAVPAFFADFYETDPELALRLFEKHRITLRLEDGREIGSSEGGPDA